MNEEKRSVGLDRGLQSKQWLEKAKPRRDMLREMEKNATYDGLTGFYNKRQGAQVLADIWEAMKGNGEVQKSLIPHLEKDIPKVDSIGVAKCDLDLFSWWNDVTRSHTLGDWVLEAFADHVRLVTKTGIDCAIREGGEEFEFVFPNIETYDNARDTVGRILEIRGEDGLLNQLIRDRLVAKGKRYQAEGSKRWGEVVEISETVKALLKNGLLIYSSENPRQLLVENGSIKGSAEDKKALADRVVNFFNERDLDETIRMFLKQFPQSKDGTNKLVGLVKSYLDSLNWPVIQRELKKVWEDIALIEVDKVDLKGRLKLKHLLAKRDSLQEMKSFKVKMEQVVAPGLLRAIFHNGITASMGLVMQDSTSKLELETVLGIAEERLQEAKKQGKNRVVWKD